MANKNDLEKENIGNLIYDCIDESGFLFIQECTIADEEGEPSYYLCNCQEIGEEEIEELLYDYIEEKGIDRDSIVYSIVVHCLTFYDWVEFSIEWNWINNDVESDN